MRPEQSECRFCGGCRKEHKNYIVKDEHQWLEEMGNLLTATVEGLRKVPTYSAQCHRMLSPVFLSDLAT